MVHKPVTWGWINYPVTWGLWSISHEISGSRHFRFFQRRWDAEKISIRGELLNQKWGTVEFFKDHAGSPMNPAILFPEVRGYHDRPTNFNSQLRSVVAYLQVCGWSFNGWGWDGCFFFDGFSKQILQEMGSLLVGISDVGHATIRTTDQRSLREVSTPNFGEDCYPGRFFWKMGAG